MAVSGETSVQIHDEQWDRFWNHREAKRYFSEATEETKAFADSFLSSGSNNELWIQNFRDCMSEALGFATKGDYAVIKLGPIVLLVTFPMVLKVC
jgi:hypothetical protein